MKITHILLMLLLIPFAIAGFQGHPASEIRNGNFGAGDYNFPDSLFIINKLGIGVLSTTYALELGAGNIKLGGNLLDSTGSVIFEDATKKIPAAALPYEQGDITSDVNTNSWAAGYYDVSNLIESNVKAGISFGRGQAGSLTPASGATITATAADVKNGATFFGSSDDDWNPTTGTLSLTGDAVAADVVSGKTFYGNSFTKQTGTLALTGNAVASAVKSGQTFYSNSFTKQAGTLSLTGDATPGDVASGKTFYGNSFTKQTGTAASGARYIVGTADKCNYIHSGDVCGAAESQRCYLFTDCNKIVDTYSGGMYGDHETRYVHTEANGIAYCRCSGGNNAAYWDYYEPCITCP